MWTLDWQMMKVKRFACLHQVVQALQSLKKKKQNFNFSGGFKGVIECMKFHTKINWITQSSMCVWTWHKSTFINKYDGFEDKMILSIQCCSLKGLETNAKGTTQWQNTSTFNKKHCAHMHSNFIQFRNWMRCENVPS